MIYRRRRVLLAEVDRQSRFALTAYDDASAALLRRDADRFWGSVQALLTAARHLQRLLHRGSELRAAVGVADDSPLHDPALAGLADVVAALESWSALQASDPAQLSTIGPRAIAEMSPAGCVRCFDPDTATLTFFGRSLTLTPLLAAIAEIAHRAESELQHRREVV
jgi:hypothetical protein